MGGWWRWALVSSDGVAPIWMVGVSASVNLHLHYKVQKFFLLALSHLGGPGKRAVKQLWWWWCSFTLDLLFRHNDSDAVNNNKWSK